MKMNTWLVRWLFLLLWLPASVLHAEDMTLNLKDADINAVITTISEMTGKNFIVDPRVKGKITIVSSQPMDADSIYQTFLAVLDVHGFAAVPGGDGVIKIVPAVAAKENPVYTASSASPGRGDEYITRVIHVQNLSVAQLVPILRPLLPKDAFLASYPSANVLIASGLASNVSRLAQIISRIDRTGDAEVEVIRLAHASAVEVARIVQSLEPGGEKGGGPQLAVVADERTNSILLSGLESMRLRYRAIIAHLDTPLESEGNTEVIYLRYAHAKDLAPILTGISQGIEDTSDPKQRSRKPGDTAHIEADESSNALVITAPHDVLRSLISVVRKLDLRREQIHVEAVIAEVTSETFNEFGIQWAFSSLDNSGSAGGVNFSGSGLGIIDLGLAVKGGEVPVVDGLTLGIGDLTGNPLSIAAVLRALASDTSNNILSTPSLVTMDNEEAEIVVGKEVPFITGSYTSTGNDTNPTNPFQTYQRKDVGLTLKVKPQINEGDAVMLTIAQEVSSLSNSTSGASDLVTNKRSLTTSVLVDDGQTIVLGGLIDESLREGEERVPLLGSLPVLGALFRYNTANKVKTNLMVFLQPTILRDARQAATVAGGKYHYMRGQQLQSREQKRSLVPKEEIPVMPEWHNPEPKSANPAAQQPETNTEEKRPYGDVLGQ